MKTLSEAVQLQIIEQAGTTFRSIVMSQLKDIETRPECVTDAHKITQFFIDMVVRNCNGDTKEESPPIIDFLTIKGVPNGN